MRIGRFELDLSLGRLTDAAGDHVDLGPHAANVLALLAEANGETLSKDALLSAVWPDVTVSEDSLYQCVSEVRRALGPDARDLLITVPRRGYRLIPTDSAPKWATTLPRRWRFGAVIGLTMAASLVVMAVWWRGETRVAPDDVLPSIAVLPFQPVEDEPRWARIGRGLSTDIANELARNDWLYVTAPQSARQTDGAALDAARDLDVRYVLDGTLQNLGETVRVSANLTDALTGKILWADRWSGTANDLLALQDRIIARIGGTLAGEYSGVIPKLQLQHARARPTQNFTAYEHYVAAVELKHTFRAESFPKAIDHLEQALALDPEYARAWAMLSMLQDFSADLLPPTESAALRRESQASARRAFSIDPEDPGVLLKMAMSHAELNNLGAAQSTLRRAIALAPNNADILAVAGWLPEVGIEGDEPLSWVQRAIDLNPKHPNWYFTALGVAAFGAGDYDLAVEALTAGSSEHVEPNLYIAAAEALRGNLPAARAAAARQRALFPDFTIEGVFLPGPVEDFPHFRTLVEGARAAGIPITPEDLEHLRTPSIAVLPFADLSDDPRWARIGRGLSTDIANELARNDWLYVTAPLSARQTQGEALDAARDLDVRYVLDGSIQQAGETVRVSANLTDALTGKILWSDRWSGAADDLFDLQDRIIARIGGSLASGYSGVIRVVEWQKTRAKPTRNFTAYEHYLTAVELKQTYRSEFFAEAIDHLERAIALDPDYAVAWALLSIFHHWSANIVSKAEGVALREKSRAAARRAFFLDPDDPDVLWKIAMTHAEFRDLDAAQWALRRAIEFAPNNADILAIAGWISDNVGIEGEEPLAWVQRAFELNPKRPIWYNASRGVAAFMARDYDLTAEALKSAPAGHTDTQLYTAAAEALRGNLPAARAAAARLRGLAPDFTIEDHVHGTVEQLPHYQPLFDGARAAGIPITPQELEHMRTPSIAVLPFENLSNDDRWARLGRGLASDIANELARTPRFHVTAPHSAELASSDPQAAGRDLNVRLIVSGAIRVDDGQVWLDARLTDATNGRILWSDTRVLPEVGFLSVQQDFVAAIASQLSNPFTGAVAYAEQAKVKVTRPGSLTAYDHYLIATDIKHHFDPATYPGAIAHLERAVELDPDFAKAWALMSVFQGWMSNVVAQPEAEVYRAAKVASGHRAFRAEPDDPDVLWTVSMAHATEGKVDLARAALQRGVQLGPNNADVLLIAGWMAGIGGVTGSEPYEWAQRAIALNPNAPAWYRVGLGVAAYHSGKDDVAVEVLATAPDAWDKWLYLALAEYRRGNIPEARAAAATLRAVAPNLTLENYEYSREADRPDRMQFYADARAIGIPVNYQDLQLGLSQDTPDN